MKAILVVSVFISLLTLRSLAAGGEPPESGFPASGSVEQGPTESDIS